MWRDVTLTCTSHINSIIDQSHLPSHWQSSVKASQVHEMYSIVQRCNKKAQGVDPAALLLTWREQTPQGSDQSWAASVGTSFLLCLTHKSFFVPLGLEDVPLADLLFISYLFFLINEIWTFCMNHQFVLSRSHVTQQHWTCLSLHHCLPLLVSGCMLTARSLWTTPVWRHSLRQCVCCCHGSCVEEEITHS